MEESQQEKNQHLTKSLNQHIEHVSQRYNDFVYWSKNKNHGNSTSDAATFVDQEVIQLSQGLQTIFDKLQKGFSNIISLLTELTKSDPHVLDVQILSHIAEMITVATVMCAHQDMIVDQVATGQCLQNVIGISDDVVTSLYQAGRYFYENQLYEEALVAFTILSLITPTHAIFWMGLGNCEYFLGRYQQALMAYTLASYAEPHDPQYHIFSAHCHKALGNKAAALCSLTLAEIAPESEEARHAVRALIAVFKRELEKI